MILSELVLLLNKPAIKDNAFDALNPNPATSWAPHRYLLEIQVLPL